MQSFGGRGECTLPITRFSWVLVLYWLMWFSDTTVSLYINCMNIFFNLSLSSWNTFSLCFFSWVLYSTCQGGHQSLWDRNWGGCRHLWGTSAAVHCWWRWHLTMVNLIFLYSHFLLHILLNIDLEWRTFIVWGKLTNVLHFFWNSSLSCSQGKLHLFQGINFFWRTQETTLSSSPML